MNTQTTLTADELSAILQISENTLKTLTKTNQIPGQYTKNRWRYDFEDIVNRFRQLEGGASC
jgi:hypothetical protein